MARVVLATWSASRTEGAAMRVETRRGKRLLSGRPPRPRATSRGTRRLIGREVSIEGEPQIGGPLLLALVSTVACNACVVPPSFGQVLRLQRSRPRRKVTACGIGPCILQSTSYPAYALRARGPIALLGGRRCSRRSICLAAPA